MSSNENDNTINEIIRDFFKWIGICLCALSAIGFFINSSDIEEMIRETIHDYISDDSDAAKFLFKVQMKLSFFLGWLKSRPVVVKILSFALGLYMWLSNSED
jgi:hypothetical protein